MQPTSSTGGRVVGRRIFRLAVVVAVISIASPAAAQLNRPLHSNGWILAAARAPGFEGSIWRTDLWLQVTSVSSSAEVKLYFCKSGEDNTAVVAVDVPLVPGQQTYYFEDVVEHFLGVGSDSWVGAIHYTSDRLMQAWARVYSISPDGRSSYGQLVEGIPVWDATPDNEPWNHAEQQWIYAMKHTADDRFRVNVGIVNPTAVESTYFVNAFDATSNYDLPGLPAAKTVTVPPYSMVQLSDPFAEVNGGDWSTLQIRVECDTEGGGAFAYASVVDNATNDAFFVRAIKLLKPDS